MATFNKIHCDLRAVGINATMAKVASDAAITLPSMMATTIARSLSVRKSLDERVRMPMLGTVVSPNGSIERTPYLVDALWQRASQPFQPT